MLVGVGMFEFELTDEVRSCLITICGTCIEAVSGEIWESMAYGELKSNVVFSCNGDA